MSIRSFHIVNSQDAQPYPKRVSLSRSQRSAVTFAHCLMDIQHLVETTYQSSQPNTTTFSISPDRWAARRSGRESVYLLREHMIDKGRMMAVCCHTVLQMPSVDSPKDAGKEKNMARFAVAITYTPIHPPYEGDDLSLYDPPANPDQPLDGERVYKTFVNARSEREAYRKVLSSRREVAPDRRIYEEYVCHYSVQKFH